MKYLLTFLLIVFSLARGYSQHGDTAIKDLSLEEFKHTMDSLKEEVIVDLRTPEELKDGKIPGAIVIDFFGPQFEPAIEALDRDKVYLLYCASGGRSGETSELMQKLGFKKIYNMKGGFREWTKRKMPVEKTVKGL